jgi:hypothetical protein
VKDPGRGASARLRRARLWLDSAIGVHVLTLVAINLLVGAGYVQPAMTAAAATVLATGPLLVLLWYEGRHPSDSRPACWPARALVAALPQSAASGLVGGGLLGETVGAPWQQGVLLACVTLLVQVGPAVLAGRMLRRPLTPELGETSIEVLVKIRSSRGVPGWLEHGDVRLTDQAIITTVRPNMSWKAVICIRLADVAAVDARPGTSEDSPWITLGEGLAYDVPPGDVVVIRHRHGTRVLPVHDAAAFADVVRLRVGTAQGSLSARSFQDTEQG